MHMSAHVAAWLLVSNPASRPGRLLLAPAMHKHQPMSSAPSIQSYCTAHAAQLGTDSIPRWALVDEAAGQAWSTKHAACLRPKGWPAQT